MPDIYHSIIIAAPAEKIYHALTLADGLAGWWTPDTMAKPEPGSVARFTFGSGYFKEMKITALQPYEKVSWLCVAGAQEWVGTSISFVIAAGNKAQLLNAHPEAADQIAQKITDEGSLLTLRHQNWMDYSPMFAECNYTWGRFLKSLQLFCETGKGLPWPQQHRC